MFKTLSIGEVLWDIFPEYKKPGGSPANVAYHLHCLGTDSLLLSRVGKDEEGKELLHFLVNKGIGTKHIQKDDVQPTGIVNVQFLDGEPSYTIEEPSAWDYISISKELNYDIKSLDAICFASLSQRNKVSEYTVQKLLTAAPDDCLKVFDLNLRPPFIFKDIILKSISQSDVIKINEHEFKTLTAWYGNKKFPEQLVEDDPSKIVLLTEGENGSTMYTSEGFFREKAQSITRDGDFVGVGDAFLACFTYLKLKNTPVDEILSKANHYAAFVASQQGAMPDIPKSVLDQIQESNL